MIRDITLGQYYPAKSILHRLDPRTKLLFTLLFIVSIFLCKFVVSYGLLVVLVLLLIAVSRIQGKAFLKGLKPVLFIVAFTAILNLFYTSGTVLWQLGIFKITQEGIWKAIFMMLRILLLIACTLPVMLLEGDATATVFIAMIAVPMFFAKENWIY